jgi:hypothetical protein
MINRAAADKTAGDLSGFTPLCMQLAPSRRVRQQPVAPRETERSRPKHARVWERAQPGREFLRRNPYADPQGDSDRTDSEEF